MSVSHALFITTSISDMRQITLRSPAFINMGKIPQKYTADGEDINPALVLEKIPNETKSLVLIVEDPNAPVDTWVHWLVWDILPTTRISEGSVPGTEGKNAFDQHHYHGPCPPANTRQYSFKVYALNTMLHMPCSSTKYEIMKAMKDHVVGFGELVGSYTRNNTSAASYHTAPDIYA
jgi:Raf kinase inhibitor-like YbhB/YbcL family protein